MVILKKAGHTVVICWKNLIKDSFDILFNYTAMVLCLLEFELSFHAIMCRFNSLLLFFGSYFTVACLQIDILTRYRTSGADIRRLPTHFSAL